MRLLFLLIFLTSTTFAILGFKSITECNNDLTITRDAELMQCYHTAAISYAYLGSTSTARSTCLDIWERFGLGAADPDSDIVVKAGTTSNTCFYDIAMIARDPTICGYISSNRGSSAATSGLLGEAVTKDRCYREAERLAQIAPEHYYQTGQDNLCAIIFVLPLLLIGAFKGP
ncbi:hypothetical protein KKB44_02315 [Candidatus Micrarchaeota archaeon]|nr:hypothetical protein [Candidatus Micrarchaeota archaeon]